MATQSPNREINILLTSFAGLGLPRTVSLATYHTTTIQDALESIRLRLPATSHSYNVTTTSNKPLNPRSTAPISTLLAIDNEPILPLRLVVPILGGKGGFGSQLRAAGGRMSSRKRNQNSNINPNGSNRNLDGRRLRTVDEAKRLAEYLAIKPEMEKKEKEERRKRWEAVVEASEKREEEIRRGGVAGGRLDSEWVEAKEGAEERTRQAVMQAMREMETLERTGSESDVEEERGESGEEVGEGSSGSSADVPEAEAKDGGRVFFGWDEEDDDEDEDESDGEIEVEPTDASKATMGYGGKGKAKA